MLSEWASSAMEAVKEAKFGRMVAWGTRMMPELLLCQRHAEKERDTK